MEVINVQKLQHLIEQDAVVLVDVRERFEYDFAHIDGSCLIPLASISSKVLPKTDKAIVLYCKLGKRSLNAAEKLIAENSALKLYSLDGGIVAWQAANLPVKKVVQTLPLERQTQISIGAIVLLGCFFGHFVSYDFFLLPVLMGIGMVFAGVTGFCGLARLLSKMPWNNCGNPR